MSIVELLRELSVGQFTRTKGSMALRREREADDRVLFLAFVPDSGRKVVAN